MRLRISLPPKGFAPIRLRVRVVWSGVTTGSMPVVTPIVTSIAMAIALATIGAGDARAASFLSTDQLGGDVDHPIQFYGVSGDGRTVVGTRGMTVDSNPFYEAVRWNAEDGLISLGRLPGGRYEGWASAASGDGSTIVGTGDTAIDIPGPDGEPFVSAWNAFAWHPETGMTGLDGDRSLAERVLGGQAGGVSADGRTIVGSRIVEAGYDPEIDWDYRIHEAIVWRDGRAPLLLGTLETERGPWFPYDHGSFATDVSADGSIVVGASDTTDSREAFVWDEVHGMRGLGRFPSDDLSTSAATGISDDGRTIVGTNVFYDLRTGARRGEGFIYTEATGLQRIPGLSERWSDVTVTDISGDGSVVIGFGYTPPTSDPSVVMRDSREAFVWDAEHGVRTLKDVLATLGVDLPHWQLTEALSISRDGRTIVGSARNAGGALQSYIAVIPEPATAALLGVGLLALAWRRQRRADPV